MTGYVMSLRLLRIEMILTGALIALPILVPFYYSIGMNQGQIGLSQAIFTAVLIFANIPTGYIADKFSKKYCNVVGDLGSAAGLYVYSQADGFAAVIVAEVIIGVSLAFSQGSDRALLKEYSTSLDPSGKVFKNENERITSWRQYATLGAYSLGGLIGATDMRLALAISALPYVVGGIISFYLAEPPRLSAETKSSEQQPKSSSRKSMLDPLREMAQITRDTVTKDPRLRWSIISFAVGRESIHVMSLVFVPILLIAGVPPLLVGVAWALDVVITLVGSKFIWKRYDAYRERRGNPIPDWQLFMVPMVAVMVGISILAIHLSAGTIVFYALIGLAKGWVLATFMRVVQEKTPDGRHATVTSIAINASNLLYIPAVLVIGIAGTDDIRGSLVATLAIFVPLVALTLWKLITLERK